MKTSVKKTKWISALVLGLMFSGTVMMARADSFDDSDAVMEEAGMCPPHRFCPPHHAPLPRHPRPPAPPRREPPRRPMPPPHPPRGDGQHRPY